jgi:hypothetical protein
MNEKQIALYARVNCFPPSAPRRGTHIGALLILMSLFLYIDEFLGWHC